MRAECQKQYRKFWSQWNETRFFGSSEVWKTLCMTLPEFVLFKLVMFPRRNDLSLVPGRFFFLKVSPLHTRSSVLPIDYETVSTLRANYIIVFLATFLIGRRRTNVTAYRDLPTTFIATSDNMSFSKFHLCFYSKSFICWIDYETFYIRILPLLLSWPFVSTVGSKLWNCLRTRVTSYFHDLLF